MKRDAPVFGGLRRRRGLRDRQAIGLSQFALSAACLLYAFQWEKVIDKLKMKPGESIRAGAAASND